VIYWISNPIWIGGSLTIVSAGEEMTNPRHDVPFSVLWSGAATVLAYGIPILAILIVLPASQVSGLTGFLDAVKAMFTVYGGHVASDGSATLTGAGLILGRIAAIVFIFALASAGTTWIMGSDRTEAVAADDGGGPRVLGRFSARFGTPVAMNLLSSASTGSAAAGTRTTTWPRSASPTSGCSTSSRRSCRWPSSSVSA
jgi:amino acid transporter